MTRAGIVEGPDGARRCFWCGTDPEYVRYHDREWGRPVADEHRLLEKLCLEGFQSGLSWLTILKKRPRFREVFHDFDPERIARFGARDVSRLLRDAGIVRHRGKIEATIANARATIALRRDREPLAALLWRHEPSRSARPKKLTLAALRSLTTTPESRAMSDALRERGFRFVGPTTCYALMQAMGLVNDHLEGCDARARIDAAREKFSRPSPSRRR